MRFVSPSAVQSSPSAVQASPTSRLSVVQFEGVPVPASPFLAFSSSLEKIFSSVPTQGVPRSVPPEGPSREPQPSPTGTAAGRLGSALGEGQPEVPPGVPELSPGVAAVGTRNAALRALVEIEQAVHLAPGDSEMNTLEEAFSLGEAGVLRDGTTGIGTLGSLAALVTQALANERHVGPGDHLRGSETPQGSGERTDWEAAALAESTERLYQVSILSQRTSLQCPLSCFKMRIPTRRFQEKYVVS